MKVHLYYCLPIFIFNFSHMSLRNILRNFAVKLFLLFPTVCKKLFIIPKYSWLLLVSLLTWEFEPSERESNKVKLRTHQSELWTHWSCVLGISLIIKLINFKNSLIRFSLGSVGFDLQSGVCFMWKLKQVLLARGIKN